MKSHFVFLVLTALSTTNALINDIQEDCMVTNPIGNTILTVGEKMKIMWTSSQVDTFSSIFLVQSDGDQTPVVLAKDVLTAPGKIIVELPRNVTPSNAYYLTLGENPSHCKSGNLRIVGSDAILPNPKPPTNGHQSQISSGIFPESINNNAKSLTVLPETLLATILLSSVFMLA